MLPFVLVAGAVVGVAAGFFAYRILITKKIRTAEEERERILKEAQQEAERQKREILTEAKEEIIRLRQETEKEIRERRIELQRAERKIEQKEENLEKRLDILQRREDEIRQKQEELRKKSEEIDVLHKEQLKKLEEIVGMTREEAKDLLLKEAEEEAAYFIGAKIKELEEKAKREAEKRAREIVVSAIQRCAVDQTSEMAVSVVNLPSDEMKGRIIGREGRNIRAFETYTGVDLIVDDTPEAVALSSFDPVRREVARLSL